MGITYCKQCRHRMSIVWSGGALVTQCSDCTPTLVMTQPVELVIEPPPDEYRNLDESITRPIWTTVVIAFLPLATIVAMALVLARLFSR